jgi:CRP-like cAMP-binding protein
VLLVLLGILGGIAVKWTQAPIPHDWGESFAESILYVLLPPLIFESAYDINYGDLRLAALSQVAQSVQVRQWVAGATVVEEGAAGDSFFLVLQGEIEVDVATRPRLGVGDFFAELSLLFGRPRSATVRAVVETELAEMHRQNFETLLKQHPKIQPRVREIAGHRLQEI